MMLQRLIQRSAQRGQFAFLSVASKKSAKASKTTNPASTPLSAKQRALEAAINQIESAFGNGIVMKLGGNRTPKIGAENVYSTGSLGLDAALGVGGLARGRVVEIYGPESSGKTTLALHVIASAQKKGAQCVFIDAEHALDADYASRIGIQLEELYLSQPDSGEQALEIADTLVRSGGVDVVVIDSVAALTPKAELEGDMGDPHMALQARLMSQALRKLTASLHKANTLLIFINQLRQKVGVMFGSNEVTSGGNALKYYSSIRLDIRRIGAIKVGETVIGNRTKVKVVKNKLAPPFRLAEFDLEFGTGISRIGEIVDLGIQHKLIKKSGSWLSFGDVSLGQGKENAKKFLAEEQAIREELEHKIFNKMTGVAEEEEISILEEEDHPEIDEPIEFHDNDPHLRDEATPL
jgi:recombination protein RecA